MLAKPLEQNLTDLHTNMALNLQELNCDYDKANTSSLHIIPLQICCRTVASTLEMNIKYIHCYPTQNNLYFGKSGAVLHCIMLSSKASGASSIPNWFQKVTANNLECTVSIYV